jgi:hypothetical protein
MTYVEGIAAPRRETLCIRLKKRFFFMSRSSVHGPSQSDFLRDVTRELFIAN